MIRIKTYAQLLMSMLNVTQQRPYGVDKVNDSIKVIEQKATLTLLSSYNAKLAKGNTLGFVIDMQTVFGIVPKTIIIQANMRTNAGYIVAVRLATANAMGNFALLPTAGNEAQGPMACLKDMGTWDGGRMLIPVTSRYLLVRVYNDVTAADGGANDAIDIVAYS